jgi:hypothetical protein
MFQHRCLFQDLPAIVNDCLGTIFALTIQAHVCTQEKLGMIAKDTSMQPNESQSSSSNPREGAEQQGIGAPLSVIRAVSRAESEAGAAAQVTEAIATVGRSLSATPRLSVFVLS